MCVESVRLLAHASIHDGSRDPIPLWLYSLEPCPGCRATCGVSVMWDSPFPPHRLGYLCCDRSMGHNVLSSLCVLSFVGNLAREARRKRTVILSFSNKVPCANLHEGSLPGDYQQERTGSSYGNPRNSNPGKFSSQPMGTGHGPGVRRVQPSRAFGAGSHRRGLGLELGLGVRGQKSVGQVEGLRPLVAMRAPLISQGQGIHLQKTALQEPPWA